MSLRLQRALRSCIMTRDFGEDWYIEESDAPKTLEKLPDYQKGGLQRKRDVKAKQKASPRLNESENDLSGTENAADGQEDLMEFSADKNASEEDSQI